jgi:hypothetical protein
VLLSVGAALAWGIGTTDWAETAGWALGAWMVGMVFMLFSALLSDSTSAGRGGYDWRDDDNPINGDHGFGTDWSGGLIPQPASPWLAASMPGVMLTVLATIGRIGSAQGVLRNMCRRWRRP